MKTKHAVLLSLLLSQTTPVWAMEESEETKPTITIRPKAGHSTKDRQSLVDLEKLQAAIEKAKTETQTRLAQYENIPAKDNKVIVIGYSGNGKTTLIEGLAGNLFAKKNKAKLELNSHTPLKDFTIGRGLGQAGTTIPGGWYDKQKSRNMVFWDCPGFGDPGKNGEDIINEAARRQLFTSNTQARVLLVLDENVLFEAQPKEFQRLLNEVTKVFPNTDQLKKRISMVITKTLPLIRDSLEQLKILKDEADLQIIEKAGRELLNFIVDNAEKRVARMPAPLNAGDYVFDKNAIFSIINDSVPTLNPVVKPYLNPTSELLCINLAKKLNKEASDFLKTEGVSSIINYCTSEIKKDKNSLTTLKTTLPQVVKDLQSLETPIKKPEDLLIVLDKFLSKEKNSLRKTVEMLDFLKDLKKDVTYDLAVWSQILTNKKKDVIQLISGLTTHHNNQIVKFLEVEGSQHILNYCKNKINSHKSSVGNVRTKLKAVLTDLQNIQDPTRLPTAQVFSDTLNKYLNKSTHLKDTVEAFDYLKKNISGTIECNIKDWSFALKATTDKIKKLTDAPDVKYDPTTSVLSLKGILVGTSDLSTELLNHPDPVRIDVFGLHTLFVDKDLTSHGTFCSFIAPQWNIIEPPQIAGSPPIRRIIDLSGKPGSTGASGNPGGTDQCGADGQPGNPGKNAGHFFGQGYNISQTNLNFVKVIANGGQGGNGGNGGTGGRGSDASAGHLEIAQYSQGINGCLLPYASTSPLSGGRGINADVPARRNELRNLIDWIDGPETFKTITLMFGQQVTVPARPRDLFQHQISVHGTVLPYEHAPLGSPGKNGGHGGQKGLGGHKGKIVFVGGNLLNKEKNQGLIGVSNGTSGVGGQGGTNGQRYIGTKWVNCWVREHANVQLNDRWEVGLHHVAPHTSHAANGSQPGLSTVLPNKPADKLNSTDFDKSKSNRLQEYKDFRNLESKDSNVSPFIKSFSGL